MLPKCFQDWHPNTKRPINREREDILEQHKKHLEQGLSQEFLNSRIVTKNESIKILNQLGIKKNTAFYEFYSTFSGIDSSEQEDADLMYHLNEVLDNYNQPFWGEKYPGIEKKYLQLSSIEGEYSYFYDKENDSLYGVDWGEMDDFMNGKLKPLFTSFYDFLEWYYSEEKE